MRPGIQRPLLLALAGVTAVAVAAPLAPATAESRRHDDRAHGSARASIDLSDHRVHDRNRVTATGSVPTFGRPRTVELQMETPNGWTTLSSAETTSYGDYEMSVPTDWYNTFDLRVHAEARGLLFEVNTTVTTLTVRPRYRPRPSARQHEFMRTEAGAPVRYDPCQVITWKFNKRSAPRHALREAKRAFRIVHKATGLEFAYLGRTRAVPWAKRGPRISDAMITIAWARPRQLTEDLPLGLGGSTYRYGAGYPTQYVRGLVVLNKKMAHSRTVHRGFRRGQSTGAVLLHELGHVFGLSHAGHRKGQLMYPNVSSSTRARFEAGDLAGLRELGMAQGCIGETVDPTDPTEDPTDPTYARRSGTRTVAATPMP